MGWVAVLVRSNMNGLIFESKIEQGTETIGSQLQIITADTIIKQRHLTRVATRFLSFGREPWLAR